MNEERERERERDSQARTHASHTHIKRKENIIGSLWLIDNDDDHHHYERDVFLYNTGHYGSFFVFFFENDQSSK